MPMGDGLSHLDEHGVARMVDVSAKAVTRRQAEAAARVVLSRKAFQAACEGNLPKGDVFSVARLAGIGAAKRTADWIPLCHPLPLDQVKVSITPDTASAAFRPSSREAVLRGFSPMYLIQTFRSSGSRSISTSSGL